MINWHPLQSEDQLEDLVAISEQQACLIFKHSTRCSISAIAKTRLERNWEIEANQLVPYYLDLLAYRDLSQQVAQQFGITHQSPQVLVIRNGRCVFDASHLSIDTAAIEQALLP
jgi:bacillithiol system protein YtxJ